MTFKEQLKNDIDSLTLSDEYKAALEKKMAAQPRSGLRITAAKIALSAAGLCLLGFGALKLASSDSDLFAANDLAAETLIADEASGSAMASDGANCGSDSEGEMYYNYEDDSADEEGAMKMADLPETQAASYYAGNPINAEPDEADDSFDNSDAAGAVETDESASRNFSAPAYNGETICTVQNTYSSDRPWYAAEKMANIIVKDGCKFARVSFGKPLTADEKAEQTAIYSGFEGTYYHAEVDGENAVVYFFGSEETQENGNPIYAEGDEIYCALEENGSVYMIREYPLGDIYTIDGEEFIYLRIQPCELNAAQLLGESVYVTTTTEGNPARYYSAYPLEDFVGEFNELIKNY